MQDAIVTTDGIDTVPLPPGNRYLPLLGETISFLRDPFSFMTERARKYGPVFRTHLLGQPAIALVGGASAGAFADTTLCKREGSMPAHVQELFGGKSIMLLDDEAHLARKRQILAGFDAAALARYVPAIQAACESAFGGWASNENAPALPDLKRLAVTIIAKNVIDMDPGRELDALLAAFETLTGGFAGVPVALPGTAYAKALRTREEIFAILREVVASHRAQPRADGLSAMLAAVVTDAPPLCDEDAVLELHHVFIAGYIVFGLFAGLLLRLAERPELARALAEEVAREAPSGGLGAHELGRLSLLWRVVQETKRTTPIVPISFARARRTFVVAGYRVPEGTMVCWAPSAHHADPEVYPSPTDFDPGRFEPSRSEHTRHAHAFAPQGLGPELGHRCPGVDYATVMAQVFAVVWLRDFAIELPPQDLTLDLSRIPPEPAGGLAFQVTRREGEARGPAHMSSAPMAPDGAGASAAMSTTLNRDALLALARIMWADGVAAPAESRALLAVAGASRLTEAEMRDVERAAAEGVPDAMRLSVAGDDAEHVFALATIIAGADEHIEVSERSALRQLASELGLSARAQARAATAGRSIARALGASTSALELLTRELEAEQPGT